MGNKPGDYFRNRKAGSKEKRAYNKEQSTAHLERDGIPFTSHNDGAYLIVDLEGIVIDFWPGTGFWRSRKGAEGRGIRTLLGYLKA